MTKAECDWSRRKGGVGMSRLRSFQTEAQWDFGWKGGLGVEERVVPVSEASD